MSSSRMAIPPTASASCRCSTATSPVPARRRGRPPPTAATPAVPILLPPRTVGSSTSPFTRNAASPSPTWSKALGCTAACAISAPVSRRRSPGSSAPTAAPAAPGAVWITSGLTSGLPWSPTTWCCSPDSNELSRPASDKPAAIGKSGRPALLAPRFFILSMLLQHERAGARTAIRLTPPCYIAEKPPFLDAHYLIIGLVGLGWVGTLRAWWTSDFWWVVGFTLLGGIGGIAGGFIIFRREQHRPKPNIRVVDVIIPDQNPALNLSFPLKCYITSKIIRQNAPTYEFLNITHAL